MPSSSSSAAVQQSLNSLLPTHAHAAPLVHLCESLLAQSRQRASHLKPDEEIARAYACCEIACTRLRAKCRLPAVKTGGAPCKPAAYKKLVAFLERVLDEDGTATTTTTTPKSTPGGRKRNADGSLKQTGLDSETAATPTKSTGRRRSDFLGKIKASAKRKGEGEGEGENDGEAPAYTMPSIRKLCKTFSTPLLAPHVYTGTCIVLKLSGLWPPPDEDDPAAPVDGRPLQETVTGLLTALFLMTLTRMQTAKMTTSVYKTTCARAVQVLGYNPGTKGVEEWIRRINREGFCRGQDWWASVPEKVFDFDPTVVDDDDGGGHRATQNFRGRLDADESDNDDDDQEDPILSSCRRRRIPADTARGRKADNTMNEEDEEDDDPDGVLLPGLATMMQDALDLLSAERTRDFETWKKQLLRRLDRLDKTPAQGGGATKGRKHARVAAPVSNGAVDTVVDVPVAIAAE
ncbi:hypothetical protein FOPE_08087 [Fonsecaea pedrosoi]|nr:hypothetical protein FOPE_08087 [Fonsecaea pedrosoi]